MTVPQIDFTRLKGIFPSDLPDPATVVGLVAVDTETSALHPDDGARISTISVAWFQRDALPGSPANSDPADAPECQQGSSNSPEIPTESTTGYSAAFPFGQGPDDDRRDLGKREWDLLFDWLETAGGGLVNHNIRFDILQMAGRSIAGYPGRDLTNRVVADTWVNAQELWPTRPSLALKKLATWLFGTDADAEQQALQPYLGKKSDPRFDLVPWPVMAPYATADVELVQSLHAFQLDLFDETTTRGGFVDREMRVLRALCRMELAGLPYSVEKSRRLADQLATEMDSIVAELPFKPTPAGSKKYYFEELGLPVTERTATGAPSLTGAIVDRFAREGHPHAEALQRYNRYKSARSRWYEPFAQKAGPDGRIRTSFRHVRGTKSGRLALPLDAPVATYNGWRSIGDLEVGDDLMGADGTVRRVIRIPFEGECDVWEVEFDDGQVVECSDHHLWRIRDSARKSHRRGTDEVLTTEQMANRDLSYLYIPTTAPVAYQRRSVRIDPYVLGVLLGNGDITEYPRFSVFDEDLDVAERFSDRCKDEVTRGVERKDRCARYGLRGGRTREALGRYGLQGKVSHTKFVPRRYMTLCPQQRLDLLRGLMDTDGSISKTNSCSYSTVSRQLADDVCELARSLGGVAHVRVMRMQPRSRHQPYTVVLRLDVCPFYSRRKSSRWSKSPRGLYRRVVRVQRTDRREFMRCITTSAPDGLFLTSGYTVTHNSSTRINLQAVPSDYRIHLPVDTPNQLIAQAVQALGDGNWQLWDMDLAQAELRVAALYANEERMLDAIRDGRDLHGETASQLFNVDPDSPDWKFYRGLAKRSNFSLQFGAGPKTFHQALLSEGIDLGFRDVQRLVYDWRDLYPGFGVAIEQQMDLVERTSYVEGLHGYRRYYVQGEDAHSGFNQLVQSSLATFAKLWTISTDQYIQKLGIRDLGFVDGIGAAGLLLTVHDSQKLLLPESMADSVVTAIENQCVDLWDECFPGVPGGVDAEWLA